MNLLGRFAMILMVSGALVCSGQIPVFNHADFSQPSGLAFQGDASQAGQTLQLASSGPDRIGGVWHGMKRFVEGGFETSFAFRFEGPGEGLAFVIGGTALPALGQGKGGLGYWGAPDCLAIEFDLREGGLFDDNPAPHLSVQTRGTLPNNPDQAFSLGAQTNNIPSWADAQPHQARIVYASGVLAIYLDQDPAPALTVTADLAALLNLERGEAWIGLVSAGGETGQQLRILNWSLTLASTPVEAAILTPLSGSGVVAPGVIEVRAMAAAGDATVARVELYANQSKLADLTNAPYEFLWKDVPPGRYLLEAVAIDDQGRRATSPPAEVAVHPASPAVGINLATGPGSTLYPVGVADSAGVVPQRHWNNITAHTNGLALGLGLLDGLGAQTGIDVQIGAAGVGQQASLDSGLAPDHALMKASLESASNPAQIMLSGIPYPVYDLIIYSDSENGEADRVSEFRIGTRTNVVRDAAGAIFSGVFRQATGRVDAGSATPSGNYVRFNGLSSNTLVIVARPRSSTDGVSPAPINGIQIVPSIYDASVPPAVTRGPYLQNGSATNVTVRWRFNRPLNGTVRYGTNQADLEWTAEGVPQAIEQSVTLTGLSGDQVYYYAVGTPQTNMLKGTNFFFLTAPLAAKPTRVWAIGDCGTANANAAAVRDAYYQLAGARYTDVWLMLGDNAYNSGADAEYQAAVFDMYTALLRRSVLWSTIGNHETAQSHNPPLSIPYFNIFTLPMGGEAGGVPSGTERYYSFDYGNIHFVCLDAMTSDRSSNGVMCAWLRADLEANLRDWLIAFWHHPPYTKGSHDSDNPTGADFELVEMRENVVPILESFGVDLVLSGHSHCYERSYLLQGHYGYSASLTPGMILDSGSGREDETGAYVKSAAPGDPRLGTVYVVAGSSGQISQGTFDHPAMYVSLMNLGSMILDIDGDVLQARFLRETGAIDDHFTIIKSATPEGGVLRLAALNRGAEGVWLRWNAVPGRVYLVQRTAGLADPVWETISERLTASDAVMFCVAPPLPEGQAAYYRVVTPSE